jgi:GNAT superfamily N-acetyltransferase
VRPDDGPALAALFARCSPETVRLRFFGRLRAFPREYLDAVLAGRADVHDAVVAYRVAYPAGRGAAHGAVPTCGDRGPYGGGWADGGGGGGGDGTGTGTGFAGLASLAAAPGTAPATAELGVLVADAWQRQGAGTAMIGALVARARSRGVLRLAASVLPDRVSLPPAMARSLDLLPAEHVRTGDGLTVVYKLDTCAAGDPRSPLEQPAPRGEERWEVGHDGTRAGSARAAARSATAVRPA